jgi:hypothetical protein
MRDENKAHWQKVCNGFCDTMRDENKARPLKCLVSWSRILCNALGRFREKMRDENKAHWQKVCNGFCDTMRDENKELKPTFPLKISQ